MARVMDPRMAVVAYQGAHVELAAERAPSAQVAAGDSESFRVLIEVMEAKRSKAPRVPTQLAATTLVLNHAAFQHLARRTAARIRSARVADFPRVPFAEVVSELPPAPRACMDPTARGEWCLNLLSVPNGDPASGHLVVDLGVTIQADERACVELGPNRWPTSAVPAT